MQIFRDTPGKQSAAILLMRTTGPASLGDLVNDIVDMCAALDRADGVHKADLHMATHKNVST